MATRHDIRLFDMLMRKQGKWKTKFNAFERNAGDGLKKIFTNYEKRRRFLMLSFLDSLELGEGNVILPSDKNLLRASKAIKDMGALGAKHWGKNGSFRGWVDKTYDKAARFGVNKTRDGLKAAEGRAMRAGYSPPLKSIINQSKKMAFRELTNREAMNLGILKQVFFRHIYDPTGTPESLREDLTRTGQIEGMLDSIGRRVTASERADRIASYELPKIAQDASVQTAYDIYNGGKPDPKKIFYAWQAVIDGRQGPDSEARNGQVLSLYQWKRKSFAGGRHGLPPLRPRDRCDAVLMMPHWFSPKTRKEYFNARTDNPMPKRLAA